MSVPSIPVRSRSARERDEATAQEQPLAPTGFPAAIRIVFEHLDTQRQGRISRRQFSESLPMLGIVVSEDVLAEILGQVEGDLEGYVSFDEFRELVLGAVGEVL